jgi:ABC-type cobalt transport system substrate-binding protein
MKKTDVAMIIFIASVSILVAYFVANAIFGGMTTDGVSVKTIQLITPDIDTPNPAIFNTDAINPTVEVTIGTPTTTSP